MGKSKKITNLIVKNVFIHIDKQEIGKEINKKMSRILSNICSSQQNI